MDVVEGIAVPALPPLPPLFRLRCSFPGVCRPTWGPDAPPLAAAAAAAGEKYVCSHHAQRPWKVATQLGAQELWRRRWERREGEEE